MRFDILELFTVDGGRALSPREISIELGQPVTNVSYHVTELVKYEALQPVAHRQVRGATEHFYVLRGDAAAKRALKSRWPFSQALQPPAHQWSDE